MKFRNIIILAVAIVSWSQCKKKSEEPYPNENIVMDNAQAALYFHTIFREAENAWGFVDSVKYVSDTYPDPANTTKSDKKITYTESTKNVTIEYNAWVTAKQLLAGTIYFTVEKDVYRPADAAITASITVNLTNFSINQQSVTGSFKMQYVTKADSETDHYAYTLFEGSAIYEAGVRMPVIIAGAVSSGQYERTKGSATYAQDDEWAYSGAMRGMLHDDPNLKYTNTVLTSYTVNDTKMDGTVYYTMNCITAKQGVSQIKISGRPDIIYGYECSGIYFESVTDVR
ncbi:MAG: hypothetical protein LBL04_00505 [Bacteroidales bacterium]|jgi:hypothetical protein|nr:hypothetical protein [Bacteroidales bacterium]